MAITRKDAYISGRVALEYLSAVRGIVGDRGAAILLRRANLISSINRIFSYRHEPIFPQAGLAGLNKAVVDIFGEPGLRSVVYSAAKASFQPGFADVQSVQTAQRLLRGVWEREEGWTTLHALYPATETRYIFIHLAVDTLAGALEIACGWQTAVSSDETHYYLAFENGGECLPGVRRDSPSGFFTLGIIRGGMRYLLQTDDYPCREVECRATGAPQCIFSIRKEKFSQSEQDTGKTRFLNFPGSLPAG